MDRKATEICKFLLDWAAVLLAPPVCGSLAECYFCFVASVYSKGKDKVSWLQFLKYLRLIQKLADGGVLECSPPQMLLQSYDDPFQCSGTITYINRLALGLLLRKGQELSPPSSAGSALEDEGQHQNQVDTHEAVNAVPVPAYQRDIPISKESKLDLLLDLIDCKPPLTSENDVYPLKVVMNKKLVPSSLDDMYSLTARSQRLDQLTHLLNTPSTSHALQRERARIRTEVKPFFDCCEDPEHANALSSLTTFDKNSNYCKLNEDKFRRFDSNKHSQGQQLAKCIDTNLHFIPIVQSQTDAKLGDCSYLDTCHKMSSCRYTHYGQLLPLRYGDNNSTVNAHNEEIRESMRIWDFTRGEPTSLYMKPKLRKQWINCDITKLDFDKLGNDFGVVVADPSWTIHMNLNYSSLKDDELVSLRMDKLQKEGLFLLWVTGRTIETGREFLKKWGYHVENQLTWIKTSQLIRTISTGRTGHWLNHSKEHLLVGIKGDPKWLNRGMDPQLLISSTRETSRKPDELYGMVERLVGDGVRKLEIFGRQHNTRDGWITLGNQLKPTQLASGELLHNFHHEQVSVQ